MPQQFMTEGDRIKRNLSRVVYSAYLVQSNALQTGQRGFATLNMTPGYAVDKIYFGPTVFTPAELNAAIIQNGVFIPQLQPPIVPTNTPQPPTAVTAVAGNSGAAVSWTAPTNFGGSALVSYTVTSSPGGIVVSTPVNSPNTSLYVLGLTNGTPYTFTVVTNTLISSVPSAPSPPITPVSLLPATPSGLNSDPGDASALVSWTAITDTGTSPLQSYTVSSNPVTTSQSVTGSENLVNFIGLTNGISYTFTVIATTAAGNSFPSYPSAPITPSTFPGPPTSVGITVATPNTSFYLYWSAPITDGGSPILFYIVTSNPSRYTQTLGERTVLVEGLEIGTTYIMNVTAYNESGASIPASSQPFRISTVPNAPTITSVTPGNEYATINFTPGFNGGSEVFQYYAVSTPSGIIANSVFSPIIVTGLTNGIEYTFTVYANNIVGNSLNSSPSDVIVPSNIPSAPTNPLAVIGTNTQTIIISWETPSTGLDTIISYLITCVQNGQTQTQTDGTASSYIFTGLDFGTYTFTVAAVSSDGLGPQSDVTNSVTLSPGATIPYPPQNVLAVVNGGIMTVYWTTPYDGGSPILSYTIKYGASGSVLSESFIVTEIDPDAPSISPPGVTSSTPTWDFIVIATNAVGDSIPSDIASGSF